MAKINGGMVVSNLQTVILAAGKGTRMKSTLPKVLHCVGGKPMVQQVLDAANGAGAQRNIVVIGFGAEVVAEQLQQQADFVMQTEQLGTGHAVLQAQKQLETFDGTVMVLCGDTPLLTSTLLKELYDEHIASKAKATVLTAKMPDPTGYGRVIRSATGEVVKIVEQKDATPEELLVAEVNSGIYCFDNKALFSALSVLNCDNAQGEYYLTDVFGIMNSRKEKVWAVATSDYEQTLGINSRVQLAQAEQIIRRRKNIELMNNGVTIMDPNTTYIDEQVIAESVKISFSYAHDCEIANNVTVGPYVHLRPDTKLCDNAKVGNFVEVKNSVVGVGSKIPHLSYIGDTDMGSAVNIGSGTITVNYDGKHKHRTTIEDEAFVGCNSNLVAPVVIGKSAYVAAGSTITKNVPGSALGVARARQTNIEEWQKRK